MTEVPRLSAALPERSADRDRSPATRAGTLATLPDQLPAGLRSKPSALAAAHRRTVIDPRTTTEDRREGCCLRSWPEPRDVYLYVI